jgi:hypothetical protein
MWIRRWERLEMLSVRTEIHALRMVIVSMRERGVEEDVIDVLDRLLDLVEDLVIEIERR